MDEQANRLRQLQAANFAAYDMLLYLDTHAKDKKAFEIFKSLVEKTNRLKKAYETDYGPLTAYNSIYSSEFNWLDNPWPWDKEAND
ncbi:MAG: spore coat protein CotJB [bacterium]|nr:spore coat protein CotJB [bacterium]